MRIGDFLDAMIGYNDAEAERIKSVAEIIRTSTWYLWNIQVGAEDKAMMPADMWRFPWDKNENGVGLTISEEDKKSIEDAQADFLNKNFPS